MKETAARAAAPSSRDVAAVARVAGLAEFTRKRKQNSRDRLLAAAATEFCDNGYSSVTVEDVASAAGVSRVTFYRHFSSKAVLAIELFRQSADIAVPRFVRIGALDFRRRPVVAEWIGDLFAADRANRDLLRVFIQAMANAPGFTERAQELIEELISSLGARIPAFAVDRVNAHRQWVEAWLLLYEILDQSNHAALGSGVANDPVVIDILTERFLRFVTSG